MKPYVIRMQLYYLNLFNKVNSSWHNVPCKIVSYKQLKEQNDTKFKKISKTNKEVTLASIF